MRKPKIYISENNVTVVFDKKYESRECNVTIVHDRGRTVPLRFVFHWGNAYGDSGYGYYTAKADFDFSNREEYKLIKMKERNGKS